MVSKFAFKHKERIPTWFQNLLSSGSVTCSTTYPAVREDCEKALDIDRESIKANYMLGLSLIFEKKHSEVRQRVGLPSRGWSGEERETYHMRGRGGGKKIRVPFSTG